jgi:Ca2+-binding RTX toxin-like protein
MAYYFTNTSQTKTTAATPVYSLSNYDILMVGENATLATTGTNSPVIQGTTGVTVNLLGDLLAADGHGIVTGDGADVRIGEEASIMAEFRGVTFGAGGANELVNAGEIVAYSVGVDLGGGGQATNRGMISGLEGLTSTGRVTLDNSGVIEARGRLGTLTSTQGNAVDADLGADVLNGGTISAIRGTALLLGGDVGSTVTNTGTIHGSVMAIQTGNGHDVVTNLGTISGAVSLGSGNDRFDGTAGHQRSVAGGDGTDTLRGGDRDEVFDGGTGDDVINAGAGDDSVQGGWGADELQGGDGFDWLSYELSSGAVEIDLANGTYQGSHAEGDEVSGFEAVRGSAYADTILGSTGDDRVDGGAGTDRLSGGGGNDILSGGADADTLTGEAGADVVRGGLGADIFVFGKTGDSGLTGKTRDRIKDFNQAEGDVVNLAAIDADAGLGGNQAFDFIGDAAFSGLAGELRYSSINGRTLVQGDNTGDAKADFSIMLSGTILLTAGDFVL